MNVKAIFDHISPNRLLGNMDAMETDDNIVRWTRFFMLERSISLIFYGC